uniref:Uncharacterized protein n=1 Tax=Acrobeloides nanus TaxID=290746 RepID=A0A914CFS6_9BILA
MTSEVQLDRDVISGIFKHKLPQDLDFDLDFKLGLVSKKCFLALKTACDEKFKGVRVKLSSGEILVTSYLFSGRRVKISEPVFCLLNGLSLCELDFGNDNGQRYLQLLRKIKGFGLKRIFFHWCLYNNGDEFANKLIKHFQQRDSNSEFCDPDHRSQMLRIISESSGTLQELCHVPDILLPHLPLTLKLEELTTLLYLIPMNSNIKDFLQLSAKKMVINAHDCYLPSHLLKNINAQTLHVVALRSWAEGIEESSVEIQANPSIQEISIILRNDCFYYAKPVNIIRDKIYDIKKIIESIQKGYPNLTLLEIEDLYYMGSSCELPSKDLIQFFTKLFIKTEALLSELQDLPFSIMMKQVFVHHYTSNYIDYVNEISSLRKDEWKDFEEVKEDPRVEPDKEYLFLKKSTQFGEGKSLEVTFYTTSVSKNNIKG